jgi:chaperonin GroEL (HSP60 family)
MKLFFIFQVERNLQDAMNVTRNVIMNPILVPGGGACEMALSHVRLYILLYL